ncbi:translation initiation factor IF-2 subunit gamma [Candidatus Micrarchaeota archaeon]|nr:translation initiation factor IF-2 subunit gamma [Candidatus Micrarchaeota archaeon]MBD3417399.1 translation initiation factor IF-2 subunit gamma [Candidatus Micrarchaeota archaeon]
MQAEVDIGLLGHVDHGKTSLTRALTGKWTDTHSEELKRGISIRLGYADAEIRHCPKCDDYTTEEKCPKCGGETKLKRTVSFLDAPGHETLMTTVISASSIMDGALLLIAANEECPMPQTAEHLMVLNILGIKNIVVVQTKVDLVSKEKAKEHYAQIKEFLKGSVAENAPIIPVIANHGINVGEVARAIQEFIPTPNKDLDAPPLLYVSRSFDVNKPGVEVSSIKGGVVGGSLLRGRLKPGDAVEFLPGIDREGKQPKPVATEVSSLMCESGPLKEAHSGGLIALGTNLDPSLTKGDSLTGCAVGTPGSLPKVSAELEITYSPIERTEFDNPPPKPGEPIVVSVQTSTTVGIVANYKKGNAVIKLKKPVAVEEGSTVALSRRVGQRWRLCGWGKTK